VGGVLNQVKIIRLTQPQVELELRLSLAISAFLTWVAL
jgi:hypothetical protein